MAKRNHRAESHQRSQTRWRRLAPSLGHAFDDSLVCPCGTHWATHQSAPKPCPIHAWERNRRAHEIEGDRPDSR